MLTQILCCKINVVIPCHRETLRYYWTGRHCLSSIRKFPKKYQIFSLQSMTCKNEIMTKLKILKKNSQLQILKKNSQLPNLFLNIFLNFFFLSLFKKNNPKTNQRLQNLEYYVLIGIN